MKPVNDAEVKIEGNTSPPNSNIRSDEQQGFDMPLFELPKLFRGIAEHSAARAKENCENMKAASGQITGILREACSANAKSAADYGVKFIEISGVNTNSAFEFLSNLMGTKSLSEIMNLSATQNRKNFEVASAQNKELWHLVQKVATETAEPLKNGFTRALREVT